MKPIPFRDPKYKIIEDATADELALCTNSQDLPVKSSTVFPGRVGSTYTSINSNRDRFKVGEKIEMILVTACAIYRLIPNGKYGHTGIWLTVFGDPFEIPKSGPIKLASPNVPASERGAFDAQVAD
jgi:hypothetical protein